MRLGRRYLSWAIQCSSRQYFTLRSLPLGGEQVLGVHAHLDALGELDLLGGVEQGHFVDLFEVVLDQVSGRARSNNLLRGLITLVGVRDDEGAEP